MMEGHHRTPAPSEMRYQNNTLYMMKISTKSTLKKHPEPYLYMYENRTVIDYIFHIHIKGG